MKTYVLMVSEYFPAYHKRAGEETKFKGRILSNLKLHTIRSNYQLWEKRIQEIQAGKAVLSLRTWVGKPYSSKQREFSYLNNSSGIGIQKIQFNRHQGTICNTCRIGDSAYVHIDEVANNDGVTLEDMKEWFKHYDLTEPLAIIHFTKFRYQQPPLTLRRGYRSSN